MKVGIVSKWPPPEPTYMPVNLTRELVTLAHRVLTGLPSYPAGTLYSDFRQRRNDTAVLDGVVEATRGTA